jgi:hypothetical protein
MCPEWQQELQTNVQRGNQEAKRTKSPLDSEQGWSSERENAWTTQPKQPLVRSEPRSIYKHMLPKNKLLSRLHGSVRKQDEMHTCVIGSHVIGVRFPGSDHIAMRILLSALKMAKKPNSDRKIHMKTWLGTVVHA